MGPMQEMLDGNCRICFDGNNYNDNSEKLVKSPCNCSGSMSLIHASCLETWLTISRREECEICHCRFKTVRIFPTFREYVRDSGNRVGLQLVTLIAELISFLLPTAVLWLMAYQWYIDQKRDNHDEDGRFFEGWEAVALFVGSCALLSVCFLWGKGTLRHYFFIWNTWRSAHQQIRLALEEIDFSEEETCDNGAQIV